MATEALVPSGAARGAIRIATRVATVYTNAPKRHRETILADLCTLLRPHVCPQQRNSPTVYTNAPIRREEARSSHLCTLLRSQGHPQPKPTVPTVYTNAPKRPRGAISTDLCTLLRRRPGGEAHVAGVVTQPPTHTSSRSPYFSGSASALPGVVSFSPSNLPKTKSRP